MFIILVSLYFVKGKSYEHSLIIYWTALVLCPQQHGFRSKHSCETQLIGFTQEIADSLDQGQQTDVIVMDYSKAFDKVDHHKLVHKLKHMGVNPHIITWIKDFLHNRSQQVLVENKVSHSLPVLSGVPQGSVMGRLTQSRTLGKEWSMEFDPDKCEVLRIHRKKKPVIFPYTLHDTTLRTTENAK